MKNLFFCAVGSSQGYGKEPLHVAGKEGIDERWIPGTSFCAAGFLSLVWAASNTLLGRYPAASAVARSVRLGKSGVHSKVIRPRREHCQFSVTLEVYSHVLPTMQLEAAAKLNAELGGA